MRNSRKLNFLITGVSSGFGRALAKAALQAGHSVIGTVRNQDAKQDFEREGAERAIAVVLDVTDFPSIVAIIAPATDKLGPIDVLVNNAGYGHEGALEESPLEEMRRQFDANVFGSVAMIKAVLPSMRARRSGHIINMTSMGGFITMPGIAYYCGSKFALEGISETLAKEVADFGIKVTAVAPGSFRTDWAGRSMVRSPRSIPDYDAVIDPIRRARQEKSGHQLGNPAIAAQAILEIAGSQEAPVHLLLGSDAVRLVREKLAKMSAEIDAWEEVSFSTDFK